MSVPEYVFLSRLKEFYEELRFGKNLWKIDETLYFVDERGRSMIKRWIQDERYQWTIGRGYTILAQPAPIVTLIVQGDSDRPGGYFIGNFAQEGIDYEPDGVTPQQYWNSSGRLKTGSFTFIITAPNIDMLNAMYALVERALYEGETPPDNEPNIICFNDYGIGELSYRGADVRPDQTYLPTNTFVRTLSVSCTYTQIWSGKLFGSSNYAFSVDLGNIYAYDDALQINPTLIDGQIALPLSSPSTPSTSEGGITFTTSTINTTTPSVFTTDGGPKRSDNIFLVPPFTSLMFDAIIGANKQGEAAAFWKFSGIVRRANAASTTTLVGLTNPEVIADSIFANTYIDIHADTANGALIIAAKGLSDEAITWKASIIAKELP